MFTRRSFFRRVAAVVAAVALAPEIAFGRRLEAHWPDGGYPPFWIQSPPWWDYCESDVYKEYKRIILESNAAYKKFFDLPEPNRPVQPFDCNTSKPLVAHLTKENCATCP